jgi:hypothetical protein
VAAQTHTACLLATGTNKAGPIQQLELVWGTANCVSAAGSEEDSEGELTPESGSLSASDAAVEAAEAATPGTHPGSCKARTDMCNEKASMNAFNYCVWNAPFSAPRCKGGCCVSSGRCASSSCAISGMGRDVPNMICYGVNRGVGFGGSSTCAGLACKLATPGCTTDAFGGNCVGTVVAFGSSTEEVHPAAAKLIGAACLDATPSDDTLDAQGRVAAGEEQGIYMSKLWSVCDCSEGGGVGLPGPAARLLNLTTSRIANFTKNEVLAAFGTLLPQKDGVEEEEGSAAKTSLLPSFAEMFKLPSLSSISLQLPSFMANITGAAGAASNTSLAAPKLPDVKGLLQALKPAADSAPPALSPEAANVPKGAAGEFKMVTDAPAEYKPGTLGSLFKNFLQPKDAKDQVGSSSSGSSGSSGGSGSKPPINLGELLGNLRKVGPPSTAASDAAAPAPAAAAGKPKADLSTIGLLFNKFINGPAAAPPAAAPAAAATQPVAAAPAVPAKLASTAPAPAPKPAPKPAPGPAVLSGANKNGVFKVPVQTPSEPPAAQPAAPAPVPAADSHIPGDPNDRPLTLAQRLRQQKLAEQQGTTAEGHAGATTTAPAPAPAPAAPPTVEEAPAPNPFRKRNGFSSMQQAAGQIVGTPGMAPLEARALMPEVTAGVLGATTALPAELTGGAAQLKPEQGTVPAAGGAAANPPAMNAAINMPELAVLESLVEQLKLVQAAGGALPAGLDLGAVQGLLAQLASGQGNAQDVTALLGQMAVAVNQAADAAAAPPPAQPAAVAVAALPVAQPAAAAPKPAMTAAPQAAKPVAAAPAATASTQAAVPAAKAAAPQPKPAAVASAAAQPAKPAAGTAAAPSKPQAAVAAASTPAATPVAAVPSKPAAVEAAAAQPAKPAAGAQAGIAAVAPSKPAAVATQPAKPAAVAMDAVPARHATAAAATQTAKPAAGARAGAAAAPPKTTAAATQSAKPVAVAMDAAPAKPADGAASIAALQKLAAMARAARQEARAAAASRQS